MASQKTTWEWRGKQFSSKADLVKHLQTRVREALQGVLGPPVSERSGSMHTTHHVHFRVQVLMGNNPSRPLAEEASAKPAADRRRVKKSSKPNKVAVDKQVKDYFGSN